MIGARLTGISVLVTRPRELAGPLCRGIAADGGEAMPWPAFEIEPQSAVADDVRRLRDAGPEALVVFISRSAVAHGAHLVPSEPRPIIAAIGPSTAAALAALGLPPDVLPIGFDSESLLDNPRLPELGGRPVFIVRGVGGRELLGRCFRDRGAELTYLQVYRRSPVVHARDEVAELLRLWRSGGIDVYTATSLAIFDNLRADLGAEGASLMTATALVTASRRVVKRAVETGHDAPRLLAPGPDDTSLLEAIVNWNAAIRPHSSVADQNND